jgi:hypothetical protein
MLPRSTCRRRRTPVSPDPTKPILTRVITTVVMDLIVVVAVVGLTHLVVSFFGSMAGTSWGKGLLGLTRFAVVPMGIPSIATPYGGFFVVDAVVTVLVLLAVEWVLGVLRRNA